MKYRVHMLLVIIALILSTGAQAADKSSSFEKPLWTVPIKIFKNVMVFMPDGVMLATDVYLPKDGLPAPVILVRTPYGKKKSAKAGKKYARSGYAVVVQDVRGRYGSDGEFYPFVEDAVDGDITLAWILDQDWCNGRVGSSGGSYLGTTQWAIAPDSPELAAMQLVVTSPDFPAVMYRGGELNLMTIFTWSSIMGKHKANKRGAIKAPRFNKIMATLPLSLADDKAAGYSVEYFDDILDTHGEALKLMDKMEYSDKYATVSAPMMSYAGWYDMFLGPQLIDYNRLIDQGTGKSAESYLIVGPWAHGPNGDGTVDYGDAASNREMILEDGLDWFGYHLKDQDTGVDEWAPVRIFVMGENVWRDENEWPLARTVYTDYYIHSDGRANTRSGDGTLSTEPPADEQPDEFVYDPLDPVPTKGGGNLGLSAGAHNQAKIEDRADVLVYTTPMLESDTEVTGPISATIYAASSAVDTDFTVKLVDVLPDGTPVNIQDGVVRAAYRDGDLKTPSPIEPGKIYEYQIDLWATSNVFKQGHRIRVEISSSNFPRYNRNLNTGEPIIDATRAVSAQQTIYHDADYPSHITLPLIPASGE